MSFDNTAQSGTHAMEIAALQIQLYSRLKDTKKLREAYHSAMAVRGGIPHPRTLAMIQELGGKMHMDARNFDEASQAFFQAFKSYDEAGDRARLRCLKYLVMASMLHASSINPFDSHEARAHRDDPEIVAMTNLVQAFHNDDVKKFERILQKNEGRIMDDEFVRDHVADLLRTIRTQVILRSIGPYTRIRLARIAKDLNDIPVEDVESLLVSLILNGRLEGQIDQVNGIFVKASSCGNDGETKSASESADSKTTAAIVQLTSALEHLTEMTTKITSRSTFIEAR
jgi:COP9 signalosome complex subunit 2